eukprot:scaffold105171_cov14-Tisochrysis_lutea.AAC.1
MVSPCEQVGSTTRVKASNSSRNLPFWSHELIQGAVPLPALFPLLSTHSAFFFALGCRLWLIGLMP